VNVHPKKRHWIWTPLRVLLARKPERATIDFETRSAAEIRNGAWLYSKHPTTRILCLSFTIPGQDPLTPSLWAPAHDGFDAVEDYPLDEDGEPYSLERLFTYIRGGGLVEAHNVNFEACIWRHVAIRAAGGDWTGATGMGAPEVKETQWRCSAAKASALALPRDLMNLGDALDMPLHLRKSFKGDKLLKRYSKPRKPKKNEPKVDFLGDPIIYWHEWQEGDREALHAYCKQDVVAEHAASEVMPDLDPREQMVWLADFRANWRGVLIDVPLVHMAIDLERQLKAQMNETLQAITQDDERWPAGIKGTERAKLLTWLDEHGVELPDSTAPTLDHLMASSSFERLTAEVQTVVRIARNINRASVSKYKRILKCMDPDDNRVRELVMYHGAATGRWAGKGIQVQNFPKGNIVDLLNGKEAGKDRALFILGDSPFVAMELVVADVMTGDLGWLQILYGDPLAVLSSVLRGVLIPSPGTVFYVADYAAIEARVVLWLAGAIKALDVFRRGDDIYCDMASGIYRRPINKREHPKERGFGKVAVLGLGYGMGWVTFLITLRSYKVKFTNAEAMEILGDKAEKYADWIRKELWPERPDELDFKDDDAFKEAMRKFKNKARTAASNLRRLRDEREVPEDMIYEMALCKYTVDTYRKRYPEVKELWALQERAACQAVAKWKTRKVALDEAYEAAKQKAMKMAKVGKTFYWEEPDEPEPIFVECGHVTWYVEGRWLWCVLPSGRRIAYNLPDVKGAVTPWGEKRLSLRFMGVHKKTKKWARMSSYGGSLVENIDQATARDMMADALVRIDSGYDGEFDFDFLASIHDEGLSEGPDFDGYAGEPKHMPLGSLNRSAVEEYEGLMEKLAPCYEGCPVKAEGALLRRYQK
jgi:DNA polymerase